LRKAKYHIVFIALILSFLKVDAQNDSLTVKDFFVFGNLKTKENIILREFDFTVGDKISTKDIDSIVKRSEDNIFNTHLFLTVDIKTKISETRNITFIVVVKERWYFFPVPILEFADRGFNEWWVQHDGALDRFEYGMWFIKQNFRGRNETLKLLAKLGFSQKFELNYQIPYINKNQTIGLDFYLYHARNPEFAYGIGQDNILDFYEDESPSRIELQSYLRFKYRKKLFAEHSLDIGYFSVKTKDSVLVLNPVFLYDGRTETQMLSLKYRYRYNSTDIHYYPEKGAFFDFILWKQGLGVFNEIDQWSLNVTAAKYFKHSERFLTATSVNYQIASHRNQSYYFAPALGYAEFFNRGYEYNVLRGQQFILNRNELRLKFFDEKYYVPLLKQSPKMNNIPVKLYAKALFDISYMSDEGNFSQNDLSNKLMYGAGVGIDFVSYYDIVFRTEVTVNHKGEAGLFFHLQKGILGEY
jgi:outer membrane protein assembly factor BamA